MRRSTVLSVWFIALCATGGLSARVLAAEGNGRQAASGTRGAAWPPTTAPVMTRWAAQVRPQAPHPEYPRPQMVRRDWLNLNGLWDYAITPRNAPTPQTYDGKILVPFPIESALSGVRRRVDENSRLWYHRTIQVPAAWKGRRVLLHFGAVDWEAVVYLNGVEAGNHHGGYDAFILDLTDFLKGDGPQELAVAVWDPTEGGQPRGKQSRNPRGIWYTPSTGIWQTVWLEPVPESSIESIHIVPDVDAGALRVTVTGKRVSNEYSAQVIVSEPLIAGSGRGARRPTSRPTASGKLDSEIVVPIPQPHLWSPDDPYLYDLRVILKKGAEQVDSVTSYFGMRKVSLARDEKGILRIMLNGKFVFQVGPLDQGFWPDGLYTAPTDEALRYDVEITRKLGFNMVRKHVKVEPDRWYYWCDKLGLVVWQDMPSGGNVTDDMKIQFERELRRLVQGRWNHPSIIMWVVFNEGWGQFETQRLAKLVKDMDRSRLVNNASGWTDQKVGDVIDIHRYPGPAAPKPEEHRAAVLGEFGGLKLAVADHMWAGRSWGYRETDSPEALTRQYCRLLQKAWALKDEGLCAAVYTQITDVETECNGLLTYDRDVIKVDLDKASAANRGQLPPLQTRSVVPTAQAEPINWRYTIDKPADNWFKPEFDDSKWKQGPAGFGARETSGAVVRTEWKTSDIWIRRDFDLPAVAADDLALMLHHDDEAEVYLNGVAACKVVGNTTQYFEIEISPEAKAALKPGRNSIAVHCHQIKGGQYIDVGIVEVK